MDPGRPKFEPHKVVLGEPMKPVKPRCGSGSRSRGSRLMTISIPITDINGFFNLGRQSDVGE